MAEQVIRPNNPRAGFGAGTRESWKKRDHSKGSADMENQCENHGSPKFKNHLMIMNKSPSVINNRIEHFGDISHSGRGRRRSKKR